MKISVVVPSFNQVKFLGATLDSIFAQSGVDVEVIVKDGGSTDGSVDLLSRRCERFRWSSQRDAGQTDAINAGLREASGEVLAYLNSDDVYLPGALTNVAEYFRQHPACRVIYGDAYHLHADGSVMESYPTASWDYARLQYTCFLCQPAVFWRRSVVEEFGTFDERLSFAMDYDYWLRVGAEVPFAHLARSFLAGSRLHVDTKTLGQRVRVHREIVEVVRRHAPDTGPVLHWLKHLASITATQAGYPSSSDPRLQQLHAGMFAGCLLTLADEMQVELDQPTLDYVEAALNSASPIVAS